MTPRVVFVCVCVWACAVVDTKTRNRNESKLFQWRTYDAPKRNWRAKLTTVATRHFDGSAFTRVRRKISPAARRRQRRVANDRPSARFFSVGNTRPENVGDVHPPLNTYDFCSTRSKREQVFIILLGRTDVRRPARRRESLRCVVCRIRKWNSFFFNTWFTIFKRLRVLRFYTA